MFESVESMDYEQYQSLLADYQRRAENLLDDIKNKEVSVLSGDRMVRVTARPFGQLVDIQISPYAMRRMGADRLSATVLATAQQALGEAGQAVVDLAGLGLDDA